MGYHVEKRVWESALPGRLKYVAARIAHIVREDPQDGKPAMQFFMQVGTLAHDLDMDRRSIQRALREMETIGFLAVVERGGGYRRTQDGRCYGVATLYEVRPGRLPMRDGLGGTYAAQ
jgi:hypothetical protein